MGIPYHFITAAVFCLSYYVSVILIAFPRAQAGEGASYHFFLLAVHLVAILWIKSFLRVMKENPGFLEKKHVQSLETPPPPSDVALVEAGDIVQTKSSDLAYCPNCDMLQPERTRHCSVTGRCVRRYDRYSVWVNNAIGVHNHKFFIIFLVYTALWALLVAWMMLPNLSNAWDIKERTSSQKFDFYGGLLAIFAALFYWYYCFLNISWMFANMTYIEYNQHIARLREFGMGYVNPYDVGNKVNVSQVMGSNIAGYCNPWSAVVDFDGLSYPKVNAPNWDDQKERRGGGLAMGTAVEVMEDVRKNEMVV